MIDGGGSRYPGARPFQDDLLDRLVFKGRETEVQTLLHTVLSERFIVLHARSGVGKTSLLNAGLSEPLRNTGRFPLFARVNDPDIGPIESIYQSIEKQIGESNVEYAPGDRTSLWHFFKTAEFWRGDRLLTPILIVDQFEELFTLNSPDKREAFIHELADLVRGRPPKGHDIEEAGLTETPPVLSVVLAMRDDFLSNLEELAESIPEILRIRFQLKPLNRKQAEQAIVEPAKITHDRISGLPFKYSDDALEAMLGLLCAQPRTGGKEYAEPFQLQIICQKVEEIVATGRARDPNYEEVGLSDIGGEAGIRKTIADFYEEKLASQTRSRRLKKMCEQGLINDDGRRLSADGDELVKRFKIAQGDLVNLVQDKILRRDPRLGGTYYELSHDTLVEPVLASRRRRRQRTLARRFTVAGVIVIPVAATLVAGFLETRADRREATRIVETAAATVSSLVEVFFAVRQLQPPPPADLIDKIGAGILAVEAVQSSAEAYLEGGVYFSLARRDGRDASLKAERMCKTMLSRIIDPRLKSFEKEARIRMEDLAAVGANRRDPERWRRIDTLMSELFGDQDNSCDGASARIALTGAINELSASLSAVEQEAEDLWPDLAQRSRDAAAAALEQLGPVSEEPLDAAAREEARLAFRRGEASLQKGDFLAARADFRGASLSADEAMQIGKAFRARERWQNLFNRASLQGPFELAEASEDAATGDRAYERRFWDLATSDFEQAVETGERELEGLLADLDHAVTLQGMAAGARDVAQLLTNESTEDRLRLLRGGDLYRSASLSLDSSRFDEATKQFEEAISTFSEVGKEADFGALENAMAVLEADRDRIPPQCGTPRPAEIEEPCDRVAELRTVADSAVELNRDVLEATAQANNLEKTIAESVRATEQPPRLTARTPNEPDIEVFRRQPVTLTVEATSPNDERLAYSWRTTTGPLDALGPSVTFRPEASTRVTAIVNGRGGEVRTEWNVTVTNRRPTLTVLPQLDDVTITTYEPIVFTAQVRDPDEDQVDIFFLIDDEEVARGTSFEFESADSGIVELVVRAVDESGEIAEELRTIRVEGTSSIELPGGGPDYVADARRTLGLYRRYYESRNLRGLSQVWNMTGLQRKELSRIFSESSQIEMSIVERDIREIDNRTIEVDFDQTLRIQGREYENLQRGAAVNFQSSSLTATLVRRSEGEWTISTLLPRAGPQPLAPLAPKLLGVE